MATSRLSFVSRARYTSPIPPLPSRERISYVPTCVPGDSDTRGLYPTSSGRVNCGMRPRVIKISPVLYVLVGSSLLFFPCVCLMTSAFPNSILQDSGHHDFDFDI